MESPVFKLEQVVHNRGELEDFEGPLDLILFLLSKNKIEIEDIPIALILDQYLSYLELRQQMDLEVASEFIAMAAQLMFIKTRMLLSIEDEEAQSEMDLLIRSLEERRSSENYAKVKAAAAKLKSTMESSAGTDTRALKTVSVACSVPGMTMKRARVRARTTSRTSTSQESTMKAEEMKPPARIRRRGRFGRKVTSRRIPVMVWETRSSRTVRGMRQKRGTGSCHRRLNDM